MKCDKCGDHIDETDPHEHFDDKTLCRECILHVVELADGAGLIEWKEED